MLSNFSWYFIPIDIKSVQYWHQNWYINQWNRADCPKINSHTYGQLTFNRGDKNRQWRKDSLFNKFSSVQFSHSIMSDSLRPHELQCVRPPCPSPAPGVHLNSCASSRWCHPAISSSVVPFSSCPQSLPASGSFPMSQLFTWGGQSIGDSASASVLPMNTQDWSPLGWTGWISL